MNTVSFYTLGCRLNQSETAVLRNSLQARGYRVVDFSQAADIVVINTCTVTEHGDTDTRRIIHRVNRLNPNSRIALIGCQAQIQKDRLLALPNVRWVVGNARKLELADILADKSTSAPLVIAPAISRKSFTIPVAGIDRQHVRANIKIQDGCDFFCSFCEIPYARGRARSREFDDIIKEARALAGAGHQEIVITGINVGTYRQPGRSIVDVVKALEEIEGLARVRISSIEPTTIPVGLLDLMSRPGSKLCRHLHIPVQSGQDDILQLMKRQHTAQEAGDFIRRAVEQVPDLCVGTDVIVGFPGETPARFQTTYEWLESAPIHHLHIFSYSVRNLARSRDLSGVVSAQEIRRRSELLRALGQRKRAGFYAGIIGREVEVLFEIFKRGWWEGLTGNYIRVRARSTEDLTNTFRRVRITRVDGLTAAGEMTDHRQVR